MSSSSSTNSNHGDAAAANSTLPPLSRENLAAQDHRGPFHNDREESERSTTSSMDLLGQFTQPAWPATNFSSAPRERLKTSSTDRLRHSQQREYSSQEPRSNTGSREVTQSGRHPGGRTANRPNPRGPPIAPLSMICSLLNN